MTFIWQHFLQNFLNNEVLLSQIAILCYWRIIICNRKPTVTHHVNKHLEFRKTISLHSNAKSGPVYTERHKAQGIQQISFVIEIHLKAHSSYFKQPGPQDI
jgi:hypothetical protein